MEFPENIIYKVSNVGDGNMDFRFGAEHEAMDNRYNFFDKNKIDIYRAVCMNVINHKSDYSIVDNEDFSKGVFEIDSAPKVDALIANKKNLTLMLLTADCLPISVFDQKNNAIALIHASSKNTKLKIASKVVKVLQNKFSSKPENLLVNLGPSIKKESYFTDVNGQNRKQLLEVGILEENIEEDETDTYKSHKYFSYKRSVDRKEKEGRFLTIFSTKE